MFQECSIEHVGGLEHAEIRKGVVPGTEGEREEEKGELKRKREKTKGESEEERKAGRKV